MSGKGRPVMNFIKTIVLIIFSGALFITSVLVVLIGLLAVDPQITAVVIHTVSKVGNPFIPIGVGLIAGIISLYLLSLVGRDSDSTGTFTFDGDKGPVDISLRALEDYIGKHFAGKPVVHSVRTRVGTSRDRKKIRVRASISVWSEQSLKTAGETVQHEITRCLNEGLGLDNVESVRVSVDKIIASKSSRPILQRLATARPEPAEPPDEESD